MKSPAKPKKSKSARKVAKDAEFFPVADEDLDKELFKRNMDAFKEWLPR